MSPTKNPFGKGDASTEPPTSEEERKESKLVSSYNLTYDQIKKQELGETTPPPTTPADKPEAGPEKKKPAGRFARLTGQFKKIDLSDTLQQLKEQPRRLRGLWEWLRTHKLAAIIGIAVLGLLLTWAAFQLVFGKKAPAGEGGGNDLAFRAEVLQDALVRYSIIEHGVDFVAGGFGELSDFASAAVAGAAGAGLGRRARLSWRSGRGWGEVKDFGIGIHRRGGG